jgi:hypothetical protein
MIVTRITPQVGYQTGKKIALFFFRGSAAPLALSFNIPARGGNVKETPLPLRFFYGGGFWLGWVCKPVCKAT